MELLGGDGRTAIAIQVSVYSLCVFALLFLVLVRRRYVNDLGWLFIITSNVFWFAFPAFSQLLIPEHWFGDWIEIEVPDAALMKAATLIPLFLAMNAVGYFLFRSKRSGTLAPPNRFLISRNHRLPFIAILFTLGLVPYLIYGGGLAETITSIMLGRADKAWATSAGNVIEADGVMTIFWLSRAFLVTATTLAGVFLLMQERLRVSRTIVFSLILILGILILYFDQGTRSYLAMAIIPIMTIWVLHQAFKKNRFQPARLIALGLALGFVLLAAGQFQAVYRAEYSRERIGTRSFSDIVNPQQQIDFFTETANAVVVRDNILEKPLYESAIFYFTINPIPRVFWPDKPVAMTQWHFTMYRWGLDIFDTGGNALPSVVGQYYMSFNTLGVIWIGFLFGLLSAVLESLFHRAASRVEYLVAVVSGFTCMFISYRYLAPGYHYSTVLLFLIILVFRKSAVSREASDESLPPVEGVEPGRSWGLTRGSLGVSRGRTPTPQEERRV